MKSQLIIDKGVSQVANTQTWVILKVHVYIYKEYNVNIIQIIYIYIHTHNFHTRSMGNNIPMVFRQQNEA